MVVKKQTGKLMQNNYMILATATTTAAVGTLLMAARRKSTEPNEPTSADTKEFQPLQAPPKELFVPQPSGGSITRLNLQNALTRTSPHAFFLDQGRPDRETPSDELSPRADLLTNFEAADTSASLPHYLASALSFPSRSPSFASDSLDGSPVIEAQPDVPTTSQHRHSNNDNSAALERSTTPARPMTDPVPSRFDGFHSPSPLRSPPKVDIGDQTIAFTPSKMAEVKSNMSQFKVPFDVAVMRAGLQHVDDYNIGIDLRPLAPYAKYFSLLYAMLQASTDEYVQDFTVCGRMRIRDVKVLLQDRIGVPASYLHIARTAPHPLQTIPEMCPPGPEGIEASRSYLDLNSREDSTLAHELVANNTLLTCRLSRAGHSWLEMLFSGPVFFFINVQRMPAVDGPKVVPPEDECELLVFEHMTIAQLKESIQGVFGAMGPGLQLTYKSQRLADDHVMIKQLEVDRGSVIFWDVKA